MTDTSNIEKLLHSLREEVAASDTFRTNARIRILNTVTRQVWYRRPRMWGYTLGTALATVSLSVVTIYAAQASIPNSTLYPVKILSERVALTLSPTESMKTGVAATIISRRITEVEELQVHGDKRAVEASVSRLKENVASIQQRKDISRDKIEQTLEEHKEFMDSIKKDDEEKNNEEEKHKEKETDED